MINSIAPRIPVLSTPTLTVPTPPPPVALPQDSVRLTVGTVASGLFCGGVSAALCGAAAGVTSLLGLPFVGPTAVAAAVGISAVFGGTLAGLTMRKSFDPAPDTQDAFNGGRDGVKANLPNPPRDSASMVLAENGLWHALDQAAAAPTAREAAKLGSEGFRGLGNILGHGAARTTCLVLGAAIGTSAMGNPLIGVPLGLLGGFAVSYLADKPGHWIGETAGRAVGAAAGVAARATA